MKVCESVKLAILRSTCADGRTCPNINATDRATLVVQGYPAAHVEVGAAGLDVPSGSAAVWIPVSLVPEVTTAMLRRPDLRVTDHGTVLIVGSEVTDPEALAELRLPEGEIAIEVDGDTLPFLAMSHAG